MKTIFKRAAAWLMAVLMIVNCIPVYAQDSATDYSGQEISLADLMTTASDEITVTFVIDNGNYTSDPGSGLTHVTSKTAITGGDLTYTSWAGVYKVTGTGTVCSYTIPAGTALSANNYSLPALSTTNINSTPANTYTYSSLVTWVTEGGMICSADTVFDADTTLYLQLYESDDAEVYSLDFVCSEDNHSIKTIGTFKENQSISQAHIDAATEAANAFTSQWCSYGPASGQVLKGWQLKNTSTGEMVDLYAGMPITKDYVNEQYGTAIKAYAVWEEATSTPVTATFRYVTTDENGVETVVNETREVASGTLFGDITGIPDMSIYETEETEDAPASVFLGWQYEEGTELVWATDETAITQDMVFTAVFGEVQYQSVIFHDITPEGEDSSFVLDFSVLEGQTIQQTIEENDAELEDGKLLSQCIWYTLDESGAKTAVDLSAAITEEIHLYTYTYRMILTYTPQTETQNASSTRSVNVQTGENGELILTITAREGETLSEASFIMADGTNLLNYEWKDADGNVINLRKIIAEGLSGNLTLTSDGTPVSAGNTLTLTLTLDDTTTTYTITKSNDETLSAVDFVIDGIDMTLFNWKDENNATVDLPDLIGTVLTEDRVLTSDGTMSISELSEHSTHQVNFYVFINGEERRLISSRSVTDYAAYNAAAYSGYSHYLSANQLESVYGRFGFSAGSLSSGNRSFAHVDVGGNTIYVCSVDEFDDHWFVRHVGHEGAVDIYYLPKQTLDGNANYQNHMVANSFYTITVEDPTEEVYSAAELPEVAYVLNGNDATVSVKTTEGIAWKCVGKDGTLINADAASTATQTTFTINDISQPYTISLSGCQVKVEDTYNWTEADDSYYAEEGGTLTVTVDMPKGAAWKCVGKDGKVIEGVVDASGTKTTFTIENISQGYTISPDVHLITVKDNYNWLGGDSVYYAAAGKDATVTLGMPEGAGWKCVGENDQTTIEADDTSTSTRATFTIPKISQPYTISPNVYLVTVDDLLDWNDGSDVFYIEIGETGTVTVDTPDGMAWTCVGADGTVITNAVTENGKTTFTIPDASQSYTISPVVPDGKLLIIYDVNIYGTPIDGDSASPLVQGKKRHGVLVDPVGEYTMLTLSPERYLYKDGSKYVGEAVFAGWVVDGGSATDVYDPDKVTLNLEQYANQKTITLNAFWNTTGSGSVGNSTKVNFFVALDAVPEGTNQWAAGTQTSNYTHSVYMTDCGQMSSGSYQEIIGGEQIEDLNGIDQAIRAMAQGVTIDGKTYTASFPSNESVLNTVRSMVESGSTTIRINGRKVSAEELTSENFTVKWFVFKDLEDGWHIDGLLVAKQGKMIVTKTFAGDEAALSMIMSRFTISVTGGSNNGVQILSGRNATAIDGNKATWEINVDQYYDYKIAENFYEPNNKLISYRAQYRVRNASDPSQNTNGWQDFTGSEFVVTGKSASKESSNNLQVDFVNTYTSPGTVVLQKVDAATGNLMPNTSFRIGGQHTNGSALTMYHVQGSHYSADPDSGGTQTNVITTDASGQAYLWIGGGSYWLEEIIPDGYDDPGRILVELAGESDTGYAVVEITGASSANTTKDFVTTDGELTLIVKNYSRSVDLQVTKIWDDKENKPVTIQLYRDGKAMGEDYTVNFRTLDYDSNGKATYTFKDLPLYADGGLAKYTLREEAIGEFRYSDEYASGYQYYTVDRSRMQYLDANGNVTTNMEDVKTIGLSVTNARSNGRLSIAKVDESSNPLAGASFWLYEEADGVPTVAKDEYGGNYLVGATFAREATSGENGAVSFGILEAGRYYMVEHRAPLGYTGSDRLYSLQYDGTSFNMLYQNGSEWVPTELRVSNTSEKQDITVKKIWDDQENTGKRPNFINVTLTGMVEGAIVSTQNARISIENIVDDTDINFGEGSSELTTWVYTFEDQPIFSGGKPIDYTVTESAVAGYTPSYKKVSDTEWEITNTLLSNLSYKVNKLVAGNMADPTKAFAFTAEVKDAQGEIHRTDTFSLAHGKSYTIENIPYGATITVTEVPEDYTAQYQLGQTVTDGASYTTDAILDSEQSITFINTKNVTIDTGVDLDGLPYTLLLLGTAGVGLMWLALLLARRRRDEE